MGRKRWVTVILLTVLMIGLFRTEQARSSVAESAQSRFHSIIQYLSRTVSGRRLLARAQLHWHLPSVSQIVEKLRWSSVSRTDAVLTRHLDTASGQEVRDRDVTIYLKLHDDFMDTVIDFAHELTHASAGPSWDPYDPELTPGKYIWHAIEGNGGEVDAVVSECKVALELARTEHVPKDRCLRYERNGQVDRERVREDFYKVGALKNRIHDVLGGETDLFPLLSAKRAELFSSTGKAPYPIALYEEFQEMNRMACDNSRKRMGLLRAPASASAANHRPSESERSRSRESTLRFLSRRCSQS